MISSTYLLARLTEMSEDILEVSAEQASEGFTADAHKSLAAALAILEIVREMYKMQPSASDVVKAVKKALDKQIKKEARASAEDWSNQKNTLNVLMDAYSACVDTSRAFADFPTNAQGEAK